MAATAPPRAMEVTALYIYPVKSLAGIAVEGAGIDALGFEHDRRFLVVSAQGEFLTQRTLPRMALISTALAPGRLVLAAPEAGSITVARGADRDVGPTRSVSIWKSTGLTALDCGEEPAAWLSAVLKTPCRLVRVGAAFRRPVLKPTAREGDLTAFTDAYPFMALGEESLADLNARLSAAGAPPVAMDRFRPNIVVRGGAPYGEDGWSRVQIGEAVFRGGGACARCVVTTTDQRTGERGKEPLRLLSTYRRDAADPTRINFGQNLIHETKRGQVKVGDRVSCL